MPGRLSGDSASRAIVVGDVAIGVGWGGTATFTVTAGSTDQRGQIVITASATTPSQATATVVLTFAQAWEAAPFAIVKEASNDAVVTVEEPTEIAVTKTALSWIASVVPVATKIYKYNWIVL
jgi:F420-0:gamma-glutamyl ligase